MSEHHTEPIYEDVVTGERMGFYGQPPIAPAPRPTETPPANNGPTQADIRAYQKHRRLKQAAIASAVLAVGGLYGLHRVHQTQTTTRQHVEAAAKKAASAPPKLADAAHTTKALQSLQYIAGVTGNKIPCPQAKQPGFAIQGRVDDKGVFHKFPEPVTLCINVGTAHMVGSQAVFTYAKDPGNPVYFDPAQEFKGTPAGGCDPARKLTQQYAQLLLKQTHQIPAGETANVEIVASPNEQTACDTNALPPLIPVTPSGSPTN
jgi:hypothetical protein